MSSCVCKISFIKSVQVCGGCCKMFRGLTFFGTQCIFQDWGPVSARERCRISPPRFLAECCKRQLNQGSFVLLYFPVLLCLAVKTASEMTCVEWGVKHYSIHPSRTKTEDNLHWRNHSMGRVQSNFSDWLSFLPVSALFNEHNTIPGRIYRFKPKNNAVNRGIIQTFQHW